MTDLIDTTEMYLRTIFELEEEGITPLRARIAERLGHSGPTVSPDRRPHGARRADHRRRRPPAAVHRARPGPGHPGHAQAPARRAPARRRHRAGVGVRPRRGLPLGARDERARSSARSSSCSPTTTIPRTATRSRASTSSARSPARTSGRASRPCSSWPATSHGWSACAGSARPSRSTTRLSRCSPSPGCCPGEQVAVRRHDNRIIAVRDGADEASGCPCRRASPPTSSPPRSDRRTAAGARWRRPLTENVPTFLGRSVTSA